MRLFDRTIVQLGDIYQEKKLQLAEKRYELSQLTWGDWVSSVRTSRKLILVIVFIALFLDNMLLTTVVPIIPNFLYQLNHPLTMKNITFTANNISQANFSICQRLPITDQQNGSAILGYYTYIRDRNEICVNQTAMAELANVPDGPIETVTVLSESQRHEDLVNENVEVGLMFASKSIVQLLANPFIGPLTNRIGYTIPLFTGFVIMFISTIIFAFGANYTVLVIARALQGIGSSCSSVSGMGMLADRYPDDAERGNAMGVALGGLALGVLVGPPFGGIMYQYVGKEAPFLILAGLALLDGALQLFALKPSVKPEPEEGASLWTLIKDPYILLAAGCITFANMGMGMLETSLPIWMLDTMQAEKWQQGAAFLPASISYLLGTNVFGPLGNRIGRWLSSLIGMVVIGICLVIIPFSTNVNHLIAPQFGLGFAIGMVDATMMPQLGNLVDLRHVSVYGSVYAIGDVAFCLGFAIGPALSGTIVKAVGFSWMLWSISIVCFLYAPLLYFLRNPPAKEEQQSLVMNEKTPVQYVNYHSRKQNGYTEFKDEEENYEEVDGN